MKRLLLLAIGAFVACSNPVSDSKVSEKYIDYYYNLKASQSYTDVYYLNECDSLELGCTVLYIYPCFYLDNKKDSIAVFSNYNEYESFDGSYSFDFGHYKFIMDSTSYDYQVGSDSLKIYHIKLREIIYGEN